MNFFKEIQANILTECSATKYKKNKEATLKLIIAMDLLFPISQTGPLVPHPSYDKHLKQCKDNFLTYVKTEMSKDKDRTILIGDSIGAQAKEWIGEAVNPLLNFSLGGARAGHMEQLFNDLVPLFDLFNFVPLNIVLGTPDGNGILQHYEINLVKQSCLSLFNTIRKKYSSSKLILYGLPLTIVDYAIKNFIEYDKNIFNWMLEDVNSVILPLIKHFIEGYHILPIPFPKEDMSSDGIHLTPKGYILFGNLIIRGKKSIPKNLIN